MTREEYMTYRNEETDSIPVLYFWYVHCGGQVMPTEVFRELISLYCVNHPLGIQSLGLINSYVFGELDKYFKV